MSLVGYLITEIFVFLWVAGWVTATYFNRNDAVIAKRGFFNMLIMSLVIFLCWSENLMLVSAFHGDTYMSVPCWPHLYINYLFFGLFMFTYIIRGVCLLFEKHSGTIKVLNKDELLDYIGKLDWMEKTMIRAKQLNERLRDSTQNRNVVIESHFNQTQFFKPKFVLKVTGVFMIVGAVVGSIELASKPEKSYEAGCTIEMYLPMYAFFLINMFLSFFVAYLLRYSFDPYFMKWEFTIFMCMVLPFCYIVGISLKVAGLDNWVIFIVFMIAVAHILSIVIPNILVFKNKSGKVKFARLRSSSNASIKFDLSELKRKAADRFCLELVLFKEDYDLMKLMKTPQEIDTACIKIWDKFFAKDSPQELNLPFKLQHDVRVAFLEKNCVPILDIVYAEVKVMIYQNLELHK